MTREEDLKEEGKVAVNEYIRELGDYIFGEESMVRMFVLGANYADQHPRKGLWDKEKVTEWLEDHVREFKYYDSDFADGNFDVDGLIENLTKAMEK